ncbi:hypothetical protein CRYUN_Cryun25bG0103600 [Craigia yunnanensis]
MDSRNSTFEQCYRCYPVSFIDKCSSLFHDFSFHFDSNSFKLYRRIWRREIKLLCLPQLLIALIFSPASLHVEYPMLLELTNAPADRVSHCGVLEFVADEGLIYLPCWVWF